ncbi:TetR/AcrR family transcriptional regulator [Kineosporia sp. J2-2]|uniref:TetR/AcrR family transcriptional regulator n=1 Tax=Kineosporia corallincola TaxID=2835133 RepID=A0ABS5TD39_9ACTN|nr:TetR/AcrR family transcriptional regulator [Kineosporia corallincola]MBT0768997.1 TetR/AcrR family transcriptional regulator [Kineosporia corallincola]
MKRRMGPDERRAAILAVAREEFGRRPYAAVSVADLAAAAGVSAPLVVFYFGSKQKLYLEVLRGAVDRIAEKLDAVPGEPSLERLAATVELYAGYAREHPAGVLSVLRGFTDESQPEAMAIVGELRTALTERLLADLSATGVTVPGDPTVVELAVRSYLGYVDSAVTQWLSMPPERRDRIGPPHIARLAVGAFTGSLAALT